MKSRMTTVLVWLAWGVGFFVLCLWYWDAAAGLVS